MTPLEQFIRSRGLHPKDIAAIAGISRQHLLRIRLGTAEPTRAMMVRIARACRIESAEVVRVADLFDLEHVDLAEELEGINPS